MDTTSESAEEPLGPPRVAGLSWPGLVSRRPGLGETLPVPVLTWAFPVSSVGRTGAVDLSVRR